MVSFATAAEDVAPALTKPDEMTVFLPIQDLEEEEDESLDRTIGAKVAMIDFAHSTFEGFMADPVLHTGPDSGFVFKKTHYNLTKKMLQQATNRYLKGLDTLVDIFEAALLKSASSSFEEYSGSRTSHE